MYLVYKPIGYRYWYIIDWLSFYKNSSCVIKVWNVIDGFVKFFD